PSDRVAPSPQSTAEHDAHWAGGRGCLCSGLRLLPTHGRAGGTGRTALAPRRELRRPGHAQHGTARMVQDLLVSRRMREHGPGKWPPAILAHGAETEPQP